MLLTKSLEGKQLTSPNDFPVTLSALFHLLKRSRTKILRGMLFCAVIALTYSLVRPVEYEVEATFRDRGKRDSGVETGGLAMFLKGATVESEASTLMSSKRLLQRAAKQHDLQAVLAENRIQFRPLSNVRDHMITEYAYLSGKKRPLLPLKAVPVHVSAVDYDNEVPTVLEIWFTTHERYSVIGSDGATLGEGHVGEPFATEAFQFTVHGRPGTAKSFTLELRPLTSVAEQIQKTLVVEADRDDLRLVRLTYSHPNRHTAAAVLNTVMELYTNYLREEHQRVTEEQMTYLQRRQERMAGELATIMQEYADTLSSELSEMGFPSSEKAMEFLASSMKEYKQRLLTNDLEMKRLESREGIAYYDRYQSAGDPQVINELLREIRTLKQRADTIRLGLGDASTEGTQPEFEGIDLRMADELYLAYSKELNDVEANILQQRFIVDQIGKKGFEISSLSGILEDSVSKQMIGKVSDLSLKLRDRENRTEREIIRMQEELALQEQFLTAHIGQTIHLLNVHRERLQTKIQSLQQTALMLTQRKVSILEKHLAEYMETRLANFYQEKTIIEQHQRELKQEVAMLPQKWVSEKLVDQRVEMNKRMAEEITRLVEMKNISNNLEVVESAPIDYAVAPIHPRSPKTLLFALLGALIGGMAMVSYVIVQGVKRGIPAMEESLTLAGQEVAGPLSTTLTAPPLDHDLETIRRVMDRARSAQSESAFGRSIALVIGDNADYTTLLSTLCKKRGESVIILPLTFDRHEEGDGLLQYLEGAIKEPPIIKEELSDRIASGGASRYGHELLAKRAFTELLEKLTDHYDCVIGVSRAAPASIEAAALVQRFDHVAVTITDETLEELAPYFGQKTTFVLLK